MDPLLGPCDSRRIVLAAGDGQHKQFADMLEALAGLEIVNIAVTK